jgi:two-component system phosphate regulon sensor histidine kinase PhoR
MKRTVGSNPSRPRKRGRGAALMIGRWDSPRARTLRFVAGFAVFALAVSLVSGLESHWELWTTGLLGLLACVGYPELHSRARPHRRSALRLRDACEPRHARLRRNPSRARLFTARPPRNRLTQIEAAQHERVANVSHELRSPLTVLLGFVETVRDLRLEADASRDYLDRMEAQCKRMQRIIDDMLKPSDPVAAADASSCERVDVADMLERVRAEAQALSAGRHSISVEAEGCYDLVGVEREIASAFGNLASNAIRYTAAGGCVRLVWRASPAGAEFAVEDNGIGIAKKHLPRLTERYYRVDRACGSGLGLAIVKEALARHEGTLEIDSEPGRGSRFAAHFPAHRVVPARSTRAPLPRVAAIVA